ncbi:ATP-dependent helicase HrpB [Geomobilimonas luticola]|uniref:ATP-dependent helicase HrpB n=1 Tax=Geomobilimonas luticola TaxID=1114878 RepID=A0ABS5SFE5_9BACT|nr:ATP-dependent helicase HrpB [Geomobilimonas luticola]MBT0654071.1 ATP-dependent helicase HrpB [Geomobilimonas luticola]
MSLPVDEIIPSFLTTLRNNPAVVLQAPPGAGKTTRIPLALLAAEWLAGRKIVMLEPRRLAATNAARWMASCLGEEVGRTVGYQIRFDRKIGATTRVEVVTEGILTRRLQHDPLLEGVGVVILDEFHERSLQADLALALCRDIQTGLRDDLKLVVMSATLDTEPVAALLGNAPVLACAGRSFPVDIRYGERDEGGESAEAAARTVHRALRETTGDLLIFLPGTREIRRCERLLEQSLPGSGSPLIVPLYGDLPFSAQERAILPADRRKVVLATNIAETSLTIEGVTVVIDSGWSRQLRFDPASGIERLVTARVSAASADQRAGRAGRLGPGTCYRLWTEHQQRSLLPATAPEILATDLAPLVLELAAWGISDPAQLPWLDPPPVSAMAEGGRLLQLLEALDEKGRLTPHGKEMATFPLHPRLAHLLLKARERNLGSPACDLAAILSERDILRRASPAGGREKSPSDLLDRCQLLAGWRAGNRHVGQVDVQSCQVVERVARQQRKLLNAEPPTGSFDAESVGLMLAWAFPDRIARQRAPGSDRYLLVNGKGARLSDRSAVHDEPLLVAVNCEGGDGGDGVIHLASALRMEVVQREFPSMLSRKRVVEWDDRQGRVIAVEEERFGALCLESRPVKPAPDEVQSAFVRGLLRKGGVSALPWTPAAREFQSRVMFLAREYDGEGWPDLSDDALRDSLPEWLERWLGGIKSMGDLARLDLLSPLRGLLDREQARRLDVEAPPDIIVPSGSRIRLHYPADGPPVLAVKLQELFGLAATPLVARGRVPVVLHLLSPAGRPIQVTRDLRNFWDVVYPEVKKELKGRYPKHPWPDDPWNAAPTRHTKKRLEGKR